MSLTEENIFYICILGNVITLQIILRNKIPGNKVTVPKKRYS